MRYGRLFSETGRCRSHVVLEAFGQIWFWTPSLPFFFPSLLSSLFSSSYFEVF